MKYYSFTNKYETMFTKAEEKASTTFPQNDTLLSLV